MAKYLLRHPTSGHLCRHPTSGHLLHYEDKWPTGKDVYVVIEGTLTVYVNSVPYTSSPGTYGPLEYFEGPPEGGIYWENPGESQVLYITVTKTAAGWDLVIFFDYNDGQDSSYIESTWTAAPLRGASTHVSTSKDNSANIDAITAVSVTWS